MICKGSDQGSDFLTYKKKSLNKLVFESWICMDLHDLPSTILGTKEKIIIPLEETVEISCTLDNSEILKHKLMKNNSLNKNMTSDLAT